MAAKKATENTSAISTKNLPKSKVEKPVLGNIESGAIGTTVPKKVASKTTKKAVAKTAESKPVDADKVAIFSTRNVSWDGVGKVYRGYNIVSQAEADKWLTRNHTRIASPEEVAEEFGV